MKATVNGIQIAYTDEGKGMPVLFLHDFPLSRGAWSKQVDEFKTRFRVIAPDLRGFGESESSAGPVPIHRFVEDLHALMEHRSPDPSSWLGMPWAASWPWPSPAPFPGLSVAWCWWA